jgi:hypothetical protein
VRKFLEGQVIGEFRLSFEVGQPSSDDAIGVSE